MLTNQYGEKLSKRFKNTFFLTQMTLMNTTVEIPIIFHFLLIVIVFIFNMSVFFINNPLEPQFFNQVFQYVTIPHVAQKLGITLQIFKMLFSISSISLVSLYLFHLRSSFFNSILSKILYALIFEHTILLVPRAHLMMVCFQDIQSSITASNIAIDLIYSISVLTAFVIVAAFNLFKIKCFRKKSLFWSMDNSKQFYSYCLNFFRVLIISIDGRTSSFLIVSFAAEIYIRQQLSGYFTKQTTKLQSLSSNLTLAVHVALLIKDFTLNSSLATQILIFLIFLSLINAGLSSYSVFNEERYFPLCKSEIYQFYDFYFHFIQEKIKGNNKAKLSVKKDSQSDKIVSVHTLNCQDKNCKLKNIKLSEQTYCQDLQNLCNEMMRIRSQDSIQNQIIFQLWKFQTGNKYKFRMQNKQTGLLNQYIIFCALNLSRLNQTSDSINQENIKSLKNIFYDKLQNCLLSFSLFYQEIAKTQPKLDTLLNVGDDIKQRTYQLKSMYSELLKHSVINFKTAEVYVQFQNFFLKESNVNEESIDRLRKIQKNKEADQIQQIYLPTLTAYSESGLIQNMNTECLSFFRLTRFQMKAKHLGSLLYPEIQNINQIKQKQKINKKHKFYTFFKRGDEVVFGSINIKQKYIQNKKFDVVSIQKSPYSDFKNVLLIYKDTLQIDILQKQETFIRPNLNIHNHLLLKWRYLYDNYLLPKIEELINQKIVKIRVQQYQNSLFVMSLEECIHSDFYIINVKFIKDMEKKRNRVSSYMMNQNQGDGANQRRSGKFNFFYDFEQKDNSLCLYGVNNDDFRYNVTLNKTKSLGKLEKDLSHILVSNTLLNQNRFSKGIKSYRLYDGDLYNIDLEDKQKYVEQFQEDAFNHNQHSDSQSNQSDLYLISGAFFILLILAGLSFSYNTLANSSRSDLVTFYSNSLKIQQLRLHMNRLVSITRDMEANRYANFPDLNWKSDLLVTYSNLKDLRYDSLIFDSKQIMVNYRNITYTGTLNQIIDVMISHIYEMTLGTFIAQQIQYFHDSYINDVNGKIIQEKLDLVQKMNQSSSYFKKIQKILIIVGILCIFGFYLLLGCLIFVLNNAAKKKFNSLMLMSDTQARTNQAMADKLKYAVDMIKKNFDLDLKTVIGPPERHKQRKKPKQIVLGIQKKIFIIFLMIGGFCAHSVLYTNFTGQITDVLQSIRNFQAQGEYLIQTYSVFSQLTNKIDHFGVFNNQQIITLRQKVNYLALNRNMYEFDTQTNAYIDLFFYENSCDYMNNIQIFANQIVTCQNSLPTYTVSNPFKLGMIAYFSRAHYNILDNITDTYGCTGLYSHPFILTFTRLSQKIRAYGLSFIDDGFSQLTFYNLIYVFMGIIYVIVTIFVIYTLKKMNKQIIDLLKFLNYKTPVKTSKKNTNKDTKKNAENNLSMQSIDQDHSANDVSRKDINSEVSNSQIQ